jgi:Catechol dioxygenase N terminus
MRNFDETTITEAVLERVRNAPNLRQRIISEAMVRHLHDFVREVEPSQQEWAEAIGFLTRVGQKCTDARIHSAFGHLGCVDIGGCNQPPLSRQCHPNARRWPTGDSVFGGPLFDRQIGATRADITGQPAKACRTPADIGDHDAGVLVPTASLREKLEKSFGRLRRPLLY